MLPSEIVEQIALELDLFHYKLFSRTNKFIHAVLTDPWLLKRFLLSQQKDVKFELELSLDLHQTDVLAFYEQDGLLVHHRQHQQTTIYRIDFYPSGRFELTVDNRSDVCELQSSVSIKSSRVEHACSICSKETKFYGSVDKLYRVYFQTWDDDLDFQVGLFQVHLSIRHHQSHGWNGTPYVFSGQSTRYGLLLKENAISWADHILS